MKTHQKIKIFAYASGSLVALILICIALFLCVPRLKARTESLKQKSPTWAQAHSPISKEEEPDNQSKPFLEMDIPVEKEIAPSDRVSARRHLVAGLHDAMRSGQFEKSALYNSMLAQEAFQRAYRTLKAWENNMRDPETGLIPRTLEDPYWNGKDTGADCFPFLWIASRYLSPASENLWLSTMRKDRELSGPIPRTIELQPTRVRTENLPDLIFGGAEYVKDGLLSVSERMGKGPWFDRMEEVISAIIEKSAIETKAGKIPARDTEANGDLLQVLPRLYWATGNEKYLAMAERIMDAFFFEVFPKNHGLPAMSWDFKAGKPSEPYFRLRDHGNEVIPGFAEVYYAEKMANRPQAERYRESLKNFLDLVVKVGRTKDGLWYNMVHAQTHEVVQKRVIDNWGYVLNAMKTFDIIEKTDYYGSTIQRAMRAAASRKSFEWESKLQDGYADTIESMLYHLPWYDIPECHLWVDEEIEVMFLKQMDSGFVEAMYLDGNFIRTAMLYGFYKTKGAFPTPWREDVNLGATLDKKNHSLYVCLSAREPWTGAIQFDYPRHRAIWNMPVNYPRLNSWPEWFVAQPEKQYTVTDLDSGAQTRCSGKDLTKGFAAKIDGQKSLRLKVQLADY